MTYKEDDYLSLSGIQHFEFCKRQWALIHIEQQWFENVRTLEGQYMHNKAHESTKSEKRGDLIITRGMAINSNKLGVTGICDVVEFHRLEEGIPIYGWEGLYSPLPVEYKRGEPKANDCDRLQLCAQAMCLEDMLLCHIEKGYLYYGETKRRTEVVFNDDLRQKVMVMFEEMHMMYKRRFTPKVKMTKSCNACSLKDVCLPKLNKSKSANTYIKMHIEGDEDEKIT
ncbi:MAG: CRISPR-associated protein Cas4 [Vallitaleaceae bacterium]|nr:CRISPR-associated protein Cas4 [Vallitaleaceae bacterium]